MHTPRPAAAVQAQQRPQPASGPDLFREPAYCDGLPYALTAGGLDDRDDDLDTSP